MESAIQAVKVGDAWGALYFTDNFTDALVARMVLGRDADTETLDQSEIRVWLDMSSKDFFFRNFRMKFLSREICVNPLSINTVTIIQNITYNNIHCSLKGPDLFKKSDSMNK